jgi:hypothetical protein
VTSVSERSRKWDHREEMSDQRAACEQYAEATLTGCCRLCLEHLRTISAKSDRSRRDGSAASALAVDEAIDLMLLDDRNQLVHDAAMQMFANGRGQGGSRHCRHLDPPRSNGKQVAGTRDLSQRMSNPSARPPGNSAREPLRGSRTLDPIRRGGTSNHTVLRPQIRFLRWGCGQVTRAVRPRVTASTSGW